MPTTFTFDELTDGRRGGEANSAGRRLNRQWECWTTGDPAISTEAAVITALGTQLGVYRGTPNPEFTSCLCDSIGADMDPQTPYRWLVKASYIEPKPVPGTLPGGSPSPPPGSPPTTNPTPADRPPLNNGTTQRRPFWLEHDRENIPFKNSAGDWFEDPPEQTVGVAVRKVTKWYTNWSPKNATNYLDSINAEEWEDVQSGDTWDAYKCKIVGIDDTIKTQGPFVFTEVVFTIECLGDDKLWFPFRVLNIGRNVLKDGKREPAAADKTGRGISGMVLLAADGTQLAPDAAPTYSEFDIFQAIDFNAIFDI